MKNWMSEICTSLLSMPSFSFNITPITLQEWIPTSKGRWESETKDLCCCCCDWYWANRRKTCMSFSFIISPTNPPLASPTRQNHRSGTLSTYSSSRPSPPQPGRSKKDYSFHTNNIRFTKVFSHFTRNLSRHICEGVRSWRSWSNPTKRW